MKRLARYALAVLASAAAFTVADAGKSGAAAQDYSQRYYYDAPPERARRYRDDTYYRDDDAYYRRRPPRRDPYSGRRIPPAAERRSSGFPVPSFIRRLFGSSSEDDGASNTWRTRRDPGGVEIRPAPRAVQRRPASPEQPKAPPPLPPNAVAARPPAPAPDVAPTTFVAVFGDAVAENLAGGLSSAFAGAPDIAIQQHVKPNGGLVRTDYFDLVDAARKAVEAGPVTYAVIDVGVNDRQPFIDDLNARPLSDGWMKRYAERIDAMLAVFKPGKIPVYWVGLAPGDSDRKNADHTALNALAKERVEANGGTYVDVWEGFVDEDGSFEAEGPLLDGQIGRLRLDDGVRFTPEGARKLAHYVEREILKIYKPAVSLAEAIAGAVPPEGDPQGATSLAPAVMKTRPLSSPLVVLTAPRRAENGALAAAERAIPARDASPEAERVLVNGEAQDGAPGRLDDYRWNERDLQRSTEEASSPGR